MHLFELDHVIEQLQRGETGQVTIAKTGNPSLDRSSSLPRHLLSPSGLSPTVRLVCDRNSFPFPGDRTVFTGV
jgi:hypothetical protein